MQQATWMDPEIIILSEVKKRKTNTMWYHLYVKSKTWTNELNYQTETDSQTQRTDCGSQGAGRQGLGGSGISRFKPSYKEWTNNKDLLHSTGIYIQYPIINHMEKDKKITFVNSWLILLDIQIFPFPVYFWSKSQTLYHFFCIFLTHISKR